MYDDMALMPQFAEETAIRRDMSGLRPDIQGVQTEVARLTERVLGGER